MPFPFAPETYIGNPRLVCLCVHVYTHTVFMIKKKLHFLNVKKRQTTRTFGYLSVLKSDPEFLRRLNVIIIF